MKVLSYRCHSDRLILTLPPTNSVASMMFGETYAITSVIFALRSYTTLGIAGMLGFTVDRYGTHKLLVVSMTSVGTGFVGTSLSASVLTVVVSNSVVAGPCLSITIVVAYTTPPRWFERR